MKPTRNHTPFEKEVWRLYKEARLSRRRQLLTPEQFEKAKVWAVGAVLIFFMWFNHHQHAQNDPIPSQAWSFGEPGE